MNFFSHLFLTTTAFNLLALVVCNSDNDDFDVIVVGAGFAGLGMKLFVCLFVRLLQYSLKAFVLRI